MKINSIYPSDADANVNISADGYNQTITISVAKLTVEQQAVWSGALQYLGASALADGEELKQIILERRAGAVVLYGEPAADGQRPVTGTRDLITAAITVEKTGVGQRVIPVSSEILPEPLRDGLLALWSGIEAGGVELLRTLRS